MTRFGIAAAALAALALQHGTALAQVPDANAGRNIAANCANCHGTEGRSVGGMPSLAGRSQEELVRMMKEFRGGQRPATIMHQISKGYTDSQIDAVAIFLASQKPR